MRRPTRPGSTWTTPTAARVVDRVKELEHEGYHFEAADASFDLLIRKETGAYEPLFKLETWRMIVEKREDGKVQTEATIKIWVDGERFVRTAEGNGPVNALDTALRDAIGETYPHLKDIDLVNFKVRILNETKGTGAGHRVLLDASDGPETWGAIGVSRTSSRRRGRRWSTRSRSDAAGPRGCSAGGGRRASTPAHERRPGRHSDRRARDRRAEEEAAVLEVLRSGVLSLGPRVPAFEDAFAARLGAPCATAVSSGTAGLHLALRAVGVTAGDEVVTSPSRFVARANVIVYERARRSSPTSIR